MPIDQCLRELALPVFPCEAPYRLDVHGILLVNPLNIAVVLQKLILEHDHIIVQALVLARSDQDMVHEFGNTVKPVIRPRGELDKVVLRFGDLEKEAEAPLPPELERENVFVPIRFKAATMSAEIYVRRHEVCTTERLHFASEDRPKCRGRSERRVWEVVERVREQLKDETATCRISDELEVFRGDPSLK